MAFFTPPETGASTSGIPSLARSACSSRVPTGEDELMSMTTEPLASRARERRCAPSSTSRTILPSGSIVMTTRHAFASASGPAERSAPGPGLGDELVDASRAGHPPLRACSRRRAADGPSGRPCCRGR